MRRGDMVFTTDEIDLLVALAKAVDPETLDGDRIDDVKRLIEKCRTLGAGERYVIRR